MKTLPEPANPSPRPLRVRRWRTILTGAALAGVGFVAAQAGSLDFVQVELANFAKAVDGQPIGLRASREGARRSYSTGSTGGHQYGAAFGTARSSGSGSTSGAGLRFDVSDTQAEGEASIDAGLFGLSLAANSMSVGGAQESGRFGGRFHALIDGAASASGRPAYGASGHAQAQKGLAAACCDDTTEPSDPLLAAPTLADGMAGPVPEISAWTMMILGFSLSGVMLRGQRRVGPSRSRL